MQTTAFLGVAHPHTPNYIRRANERDDVQVKVVCDHNPERGTRRAAEMNAAFTPNVNDILNDPQIESVVICSETILHGELIKRAAAAGKHMFVEKPLAISGEEAEILRARIERAGVIFQMGFPRRSLPESQFLKQEVEAGQLGTITRMRHTACHEGALAGWLDGEWSWMTDAAQSGGGGFADLGAHSLDMILWVLNEYCGGVKSVAASVGQGVGRYGEIDEFGTGLITFASGATAVLEASWVDPKLRSAIEVHGTEGQIQISGGKVYYYSERVAGADGGEWTQLPAWQPHAFELFFDKLAGKELEIELVTAAEAANGSRIMAEMYSAARH